MNKQEQNELKIGERIDFKGMIFDSRFYAWDCVGFQMPLTPAHKKGFDKVGIDTSEVGLEDKDFIDGTKDIIQKYTQFCMRIDCIDEDGHLVPERMYFNARYALFFSVDRGNTWVFGGTPIEATKSNSYEADSGIIWSGSFLPDKDGNVLASYTGVPKLIPEGAKNELSEYVLQNIMGASSDDGGFTFKKEGEPLISALRDFDDLREAGYYLGDRKKLGMENDPDGTHMTQRDMQLLRKSDGSLWGYFAAKAISEKHKTGVEPCICQVEFNNPKKLGDGIKKIGPPMMLPEGPDREFNQLECPNVLVNDKGENVVIASLAQHWKIGQPESTAVKEVKAYKVTEGKNGYLGTLEAFGNPNKLENTLLTNKEHGLYALCVITNQSSPGEYDCAAFQVKEDHKYQLPSMRVNLNGEKPNIEIPDLNYYRGLVNDKLIEIARDTTTGK